MLFSYDFVCLRFDSFKYYLVYFSGIYLSNYTTSSNLDGLSLCVQEEQDQEEEEQYQDPGSIMALPDPNSWTPEEEF